MTTIAYRWGVMASDSRFVVNGWKQPALAKKLFRMNDGGVCGVTGDYAVSVAYVKWLNGDRESVAPNLGEGGRVIHLNKSGTITIYEQTGCFEIETEFAAWGSGSSVANAAFYMGADAVKAVEIAALLDDGTGGPIVTMKCEV